MDIKKVQLPKFRELPVTAELDLLLMQARTNVVLGSSIYAYTMMRCEYIFTDELPIPTAASVVHGDRNIIYFDPKFFTETLTNSKQRAFVLVHELDHIFFMHQKHCIDMMYDHDLYNEATDYFINLGASGVYLDSNGHKKVNKKYTDYFEMPSCGLYEEKYLGWSSDKIYEDLLKNGSKMKSPGGMDVFLGDGGTNAQQIKNVQTLQAAVVFAEKSNQIGENEGELVSRIRAMAKPVVCWTDRLAATVQSSIKIRPTYNRLSRRSDTTGNGVIFPSYSGTKISILFGFDSSGSMGDSDYAKVAGELKGILQQFDGWDLHLVCCDMVVTDLGKYSSEEMDTFDAVSLNYRGGGGTLMGGIARKAQELIDEGIHLDACIVVTDGGIHVKELDDSFPRETTNIVVTTRNTKLEFKNAECIPVTK